MTDAGTGKKARVLGVEVAGKTGTSQVVKMGEDRNRANRGANEATRDHAWFISYAPTVTPRIAVGVLVEHMGHGGSAAAPLAKQLIETFIKLAPHEPLIADSPSPARSPMTVMARQEPRD